MLLSRILNTKKIRLSAVFALFSAVFIFQSPLKAQNPDTAFSASAETDASIPAVEQPAHGEEKFDPAVAIMGHIADSHEWHLWGHTSLPLPIILYTDKGIETFSSSKFEHGTKAYQGKYYTYKLIDDKIAVVDVAGNVDKEAGKRVYDFSITKNIVSIWIAVVLLLLIFTSVASAYKKREGRAPKGLQSF